MYYEATMGYNSGSLCHYSLTWNTTTFRLSV